MLDHVFTDAIDALGQSLEKALLERVAVEEHLTADVLLGDLSFETSYGLLGESAPVHVRADIGMQWSTWSQSAFRDWYTGEGVAEAPRIEIEVTLRVQRLAEQPDVAALLAATPATGPTVGSTTLYRSGPSMEQVFDPELAKTASAFEVAYSGTYELDEAALEDSALIDIGFGPLGGWIAAALVRLNDLPLRHLPADTPDDM